MKNRSQPFDCSIAAKTVGISLRHGGGLQEPASVYVRCEERDCQYVDLNQAPCPLRIDMFADGSDRQVADHLTTHAGERYCYACLTELLGVTHDQVRRASWRLKDAEDFSIRPSRCVNCQRRRVTIALGRSEVRNGSGNGTVAVAPLDLSAPAATGEDQEKEPDPAGRVINFLIDSPGLAYCASCVAFATDVGLGEAKRLLTYLEAVAQFRHRGSPCAACGRWQSSFGFSGGEIVDAARVTELTDVLAGHTEHRGFGIDLLSFRTADGWRPFALVKTSAGALAPEAPPIVLDLTPTKVEADEVAAIRARAWIDKAVP